jgi:hypothetical protein
VGVAFVRRELVEVAEIDRFNGRRKKAEYDEPVQNRGNMNHTLREHGHRLGLPIDIGVVGSTSIAYCSRFGVGTYDRSEMGDSCLTIGCADAAEPLPGLSSCRE